MTNAQKRDLANLRIAAINGSTGDKARYVRFLSEHLDDDALMTALLLFFIQELLGAGDDD